MLVELFLLHLHLRLGIVDDFLLRLVPLFGILRHIRIELGSLTTCVVGIDEFTTQAFLLRDLLFKAFADGLQLAVVLLPLRTEFFRELHHILQPFLLTLQHLVGHMATIVERFYDLIGTAFELVEDDICLVDDFLNDQSLAAVALIAEDETVVLPLATVHARLNLLTRKRLDVARSGMLPQLIPGLGTLGKSGGGFHIRLGQPLLILDFLLNIGGLAFEGYFFESLL